MDNKVPEQISDRLYKKLHKAITEMKRGDKLSTFFINELSLVDWFALRFVHKNIIKIINIMRRHQPFYKTLKAGLTNLGYWKLKARGNPKEGFKTGLGKNKRE